MAITASDISFRYSGGSGNTNANNSTGGVMSTVNGGKIVSDQLNNDMDDITSAEASSGITITHGYYYDNEHATLTYISPKFYIDSQTSSGDTTISVGRDSGSVNSTMQSLSNEQSTPSGISFSSPANFAAGISLGNLNAGQNKGIWIRYRVNSSAAAALDQYTMGIQGDTNV